MKNKSNTFVVLICTFASVFIATFNTLYTTSAYAAAKAPVPVITSINPLTGSVAGGTRITLQGTNIDKIISVILVVTKKTDTKGNVIADSNKNQSTKGSCGMVSGQMVCTMPNAELACKRDFDTCEGRLLVYYGDIIPATSTKPQILPKTSKLQDVTFTYTPCTPDNIVLTAIPTQTFSKFGGEKITLKGTCLSVAGAVKLTMTIPSNTLEPKIDINTGLTYNQYNKDPILLTPAIPVKYKKYAITSTLLTLIDSAGHSITKSNGAEITTPITPGYK